MIPIDPLGFTRRSQMIPIDPLGFTRRSQMMPIDPLGFIGRSPMMPIGRLGFMGRSPMTPIDRLGITSGTPMMPSDRPGSTRGPAARRRRQIGHFTMSVIVWLQSPWPLGVMARNRKLQPVPTGRPKMVVFDCVVDGAAVQVLPASALHSQS